MHTTPHGSPHRRAKLLIGLLGLAAFLGLSLSMVAQDAGKDKDKGKDKPDKAAPAIEGPKDGKGAKKKDDSVRPLQKVRTSGYTLPGNIADLFDDKGDVKPAGLVYKDKLRIIGGTVFFVVLERSEADGDTWGTSIPKFDRSFVAGRNFEGGYSRGLDTAAQYLYLYQVVNDRGLRPTKAGGKGAKGELTFPVHSPDDEATPIGAAPEDIASFALRLRVDPRYVTSWGSFRGQGLIRQLEAAQLPASLPKTDPIRQVVDDAGGKIMMAVSGQTSRVTPLPKGQRYEPRSPHYALTELWKTADYGIASSTLKLDDQRIKVALDNSIGKGKGAIAQVAANMQAVAEAARVPDFVQVMYHDGQTPNGRPGAVAAELELTTPDNDEDAYVIFRADWRGTNQLKFGQHSVIFGFTSDLPPREEPIRVDNLTAAGLQRGVKQFAVSPLAAAFGSGTVTDAARFAAFGEDASGTGTGVGFAVGADGSQARPGGSAVLSGGTSGSIGGLGGVGGGAGGFPGGAIGAAPPPLFGGGGGFGGSGSGTPSSSTTPGQAAQQGQQGVVINIKVSQQQQQQQQQGQHQHQGQGQTPPPPPTPGVVPAPASLLLGLLGLPGLFLLRRRSQPAAPA